MLFKMIFSLYIQWKDLKLLGYVWKRKKHRLWIKGFKISIACYNLSLNFLPDFVYNISQQNSRLWFFYLTGRIWKYVYIFWCSDHLSYVYGLPPITSSFFLNPLLTYSQKGPFIYSCFIYFIQINTNNNVLPATGLIRALVLVSRRISCFINDLLSCFQDKWENSCYFYLFSFIK